MSQGQSTQDTSKGDVYSQWRDDAASELANNDPSASQSCVTPPVLVQDCSASKYGCCDDGTTTKSDESGSNCSACVAPETQRAYELDPGLGKWKCIGGSRNTNDCDPYRDRTEPDADCPAQKDDPSATGACTYTCDLWTSYDSSGNQNCPKGVPTCTETAGPWSDPPGTTQADCESATCD